MGQVVIRNIDDAVLARLKEKAERANRPLEQTLREILADAARPSKDEVLARLDAIRARSTYTTLDATDLIREDRDR
jgi:plasmid stability protein